MRNSKIRKIIFIWLAIGHFSANAQQNNPLYDLQKIHFGFSIIGDHASYKLNPSQDFWLDNQVLNIEQMDYAGFGFGGLMNARISDHFDFRTALNLHFTQRDLVFTFSDQSKRQIEMENTYFEVPMLIKLKSIRHRNVRIYVIGGVNYRYDFASDIDTDRSFEKPIVALSPSTYSYDLGLGFDLYFEFFKFSPEIKLSSALNSYLARDKYIFSQSIGSLMPRLVQISFSFE